MLRFHAHVYVKALSLLGQIEGIILLQSEVGVPDEEMPDSARDVISGDVRALRSELDAVGLKMSSLSAERLAATLEKCQLVINEDLAYVLRDLRSRMEDELGSRFFLSLLPSEKEYYDPPTPLFGEEVQNKFSDMQVDIEEAGKCLALGRSTACVFHLMRIMEKSVRLFGNQLGLTKEQTKHWHNTVEHASKVIKDLPQNDPLTERYAAIASHLYNVKVAWRNPVSHVRGTYTPDQAEDIFSNVGSFMRELVEVL